MKCLVLAAGYATRLYPLTENFPKPLLKVGEKSILDWLLDDISSTGLVDAYGVISNHKFAACFEEWAKNRANNSSSDLKIVDDLTETNETRLGAVKDIEFALEKLGWDDDLLVVAGDNVLDFSLGRFLKYAIEKKTSCVMRYYEKDAARLKKCGVVQTDPDGLILLMEEKPSEPRSNWCVPPFYVYSRSDSKKIKEGIDSGCGTDAPGSFISWLCKVSPVHAMEMPGKRFDIGNLESYEKVKSEYKGILTV
ncbi:MAG: nucleotidyltransferase family protein [Clostridia bacterium]|nr:nucleotidyltransferase family protein [Clostridia bacterium]